MTPSAGNNGLAILQFRPADTALEVATTLNAQAAADGYLSNALVLFDYQGPTNFKYAGLFIGSSQWRIGYVAGSTWTHEAMIADTVSAGTDYDVSVVLIGNKAQLSVDGVVKGSYVYGDSVTDGSAGLGTKNAVGRFDDLAVRETGATLPYVEDFEDGNADFLAVAAGTWQINTAGRYKATAAVGNSAILLLQTDAALPSLFDITALITGNTAASGQFTNGLIIFDYKGPADFKYAGAFFGNNQWRIGHYDGSWNTLASAMQSITTGTDYDLKVSVNATAVELLVGGVSKVTHDFAASLSGGQMGVGTNNAVARFDDLSVQAPDGS